MDREKSFRKELIDIHNYVSKNFFIVNYTHNQNYAVIDFNCYNKSGVFCEQFVVPYVIISSGTWKEYLEKHYDFFKKQKLKDKLND